ncbi:MAG: CPBP family intramembrane metalloprotease [Flavobacteriales bacterium]|nr:CPBP family intramembrane metalloprotease [Flavobacteriales bacterium]
MLKAFFESKDYGTKIIILVVLALVIGLMSLLLGVGLLATIHDVPFSDAEKMATDILHLGSIRFLLLFQHLGLFVIPAILFTYLTTTKRTTFLQLDSFPSSQSIILVGALIVVAVPLIDWTGTLNKAVHFPEMFADLEESMRAAEVKGDKLIKALLGDQSVLILLINTLLIAVLPAIGEELIFRGCLQTTLANWTKNVHYGVWIAAFWFSLIHFQLFSFLPRFLLGAGLGYLLIWSKSLWLPIIAHFLNNFMAIMVTYLAQTNTINSEFAETENNAIYGISICISALLVAYILYSIHKIETKKRVPLIHS